MNLNDAKKKKIQKISIYFPKAFFAQCQSTLVGLLLAQRGNPPRRAPKHFLTVSCSGVS